MLSHGERKNKRKGKRLGENGKKNEEKRWDHNESNNMWQ